MRKLELCDYVFLVMIFVIIALTSMGIHSGTTIERSPCHILSSPTDIQCTEKTNPMNSYTSYYLYLEYKVHIVFTNETTIGRFDCGYIKDCNTKCPGNTSLTVGVLRDCYTMPLMKPEYIIENKPINLYANQMLIVSSVILSIALIGLVVYAVNYFYECGRIKYQQVN